MLAPMFPGLGAEVDPAFCPPPSPLWPADAAYAVPSAARASVSVSVNTQTFLVNLGFMFPLPGRRPPLSTHRRPGATCKRPMGNFVTRGAGESTGARPVAELLSSPSVCAAPTSAHSTLDGLRGELRPLLEPSSVAIVGASDRRGEHRTILANARRGGV